MYRFRKLYSRVSRGWKALLLENGNVKNVNHIHVTYVLGEILLLWKLFPEKASLLTFCLLMHLINFLLGIKDKAEAKDASSKKFAVKVYWGLEVFVFLMGCVVDWRLILLHEAASYIVPLFFFGLQNVLLRIWLFERKSPYILRRIAQFLCCATTFMPCYILGILLLASPSWMELKVISWVLYLTVGMPLMAEFEDSEENLFEFAFEMTN